MLSIFRYTNKLSSVFQVRFLHPRKTVTKKQYSYDLDSLIEWKKETVMAFGPVRKPTKTGKIKKSKKSLPPHVKENLETLSAMSASQDSWDNHTSPAVKNGSKRSKSYGADRNIPDALYYLPPSDTLPVSGQGYQEKSSSNTNEDIENSVEDIFDIPDDVFISSLIPHDAVPVMDNIYNDDGDRECELSVFCDPEDDVIIEKISPVPAASFRTSTRKFNKCLGGAPVGPAATVRLSPACTSMSEQPVKVTDMEVMNTVNVRDDMAESSISSIPFSATSDDSKNGKSIKKASSKTKDASSAIVSDSRTKYNSKEEKLAQTEIFIPKIQPIPVGNTSVTPQSPASSQTSATLNLPFEPPESFDIITKIPLFPKESSDWQDKIDSHLLTAFRTDVEQMSLRVLPPVKTILTKTMSDLNRYFLSRWREGMIKDLGEEGFAKHQEATIKNGLNLHANVMEYLSGKPVSELQIMPDNEGHWSSLQSALATICNVRALEVEVSHNLLPYRGVFDCLAQYKDLLCIIDWKTSKKTRPLLKNTYDDPVQVAAYVGALNSSEVYVQKYGQVNHGVIVVGYSDGSPAHIHVMNRATCEQYWRDWTERLYSYYQLIYTEKMAARMGKINAKKMKMSSVGAVQ